MNPALKQGVFQLIYNTFLHNSDAIALFFGIIVCIVLLFRRPKRILMFFLVGFTCLLLRFEYIYKLL